MRHDTRRNDRSRSPADGVAMHVARRLKGWLRKTRLLSRRRAARRRSSLVRRFQALLMSWGLLIYVMAVAGFWFASNSVIKSTFEQQAVEWAARINHISTPVIGEAGADMADIEGSADYADVKQYLENYTEISYVQFYRLDRSAPLTSYVRENVDRSVLRSADVETGPTTQQLQKILDGEVVTSRLSGRNNLLRVISPVRAGAGVIGYTDIGVNYTSYKDRLAKNALAGSVIISFIFLLAAVIGRQLITNALRPLLELQEPLERLARGELDLLVSHDGDEEIVAIRNALNSTISAIKGRDAELRRLADYDALTGLINKRSFTTVLDKERRRIARGEDTSALFFIDLDQFKYINDTLGHTAGDRLLMQVADLLRSRMRSDDVVSRLGGDEFAVLARSVDREGAVEIASGLVKSMYEFMFVEQGRAFNIYCSIGVTLIENDGYSTDAIFSHADMACYTAKSQGRNRFKFFEPDSDENNKIDIGWSHRIAHALANNDFVLHYQPIIGISRHDLPCFEVLVRMRGEEGEIIPPNMFISIAERFGLATEIDYWVIRNAMHRLARLNAEGRKSRFYVNLSGQLLVDPDFVDRVLEMFEASGIDAGQVVFELTERAAVGNLKAASEKMTVLRQHGFLFAVDDFGSGFSSFSYLKHMPVEIVKIEGEFVERLIEDEVDRALVKSMVDIAKACGKQVIAEFVSDQQTLELLTSYGIDYAQGFYLAMPEAEPAFTNYFDSANTEFVAADIETLSDTPG